MNHLSFLLAFLLFSLEIFAQKAPIKFGDIPKSDLEMRVYPADTSAAAVVLCDYGNLEFVFKDDDIGFDFHRHRRIKILRRAGFGQGDITIPFYSKDNLEKITSLKVEVFAPDGTKTELEKSQIFEEKVNKNWSQKRFSCPNLQEGSIIEYRYDLESKYIFQLPEWYFQDDIPVRWSELRIEQPEFYEYMMLRQNCKLEIDVQSETQRSFPYFSSFNGTGSFSTKVVKFSLAMKDVPALKEEAFITTMDDYRASIRFQLSAVRFPDQPVEPVMSTWEKVASELIEDEDFGGRFLKKKNYEQVLAAAQSTLSGAATQEEKVAALHHYLRTQFTIEDGGGIYVSRNLNDCFEKKSAQSKELNLLLVALLREAGIEAHPALLSTRKNGKPTTLYPFLEQFDHVMAVAFLGEKQVLLDVSNPFLAPGFPDPNSLNYEAWLVRKGNPAWFDISPPNGSDTWFLNFSLNDEGTLSGALAMSSDGYSAVNEREMLDEKPGGEHLKNRMTRIFPDARIDSMHFENQENLNKPFKAFLQCHLPHSAQISGDFIYLSPAPVSAFDETPFKLEKRTFPVDIPYPFKEQIVLNLTLPPGYVVEDVPESLKLSTPDEGAKFTYRVTNQGNGKLQVISNLQVTKLHFEPEEYDVLRGFFSMVEEKLGEQVVLKKG